MRFKYSFDRRSVHDALNIIDDIYSGNFSIENTVTTYLKKFAAETQTQFDRRLDTSVFYNYLKPIINVAAEKPFNQAVTYQDEFPEDLEYLKNSLDASGNPDIKTCLNIMTNGLKHGFCLLFPDFDSEDSRGFIKVVKATDVIGVWGRPLSDGNYHIERAQFFVKLTELEEKGVTVSEDGVRQESERAEFEEVNYHYVYDFVHPNIVRKYSVTDENVDYRNEALEVNTELVEEVVLDGFDKLPIYLFTTNDSIRDDSLINIPPPFYDVAKINLSHYNKKSDQDSILAVSRFALLFANGISQEESQQIFTDKDGSSKGFGPNSLIVSSNPDAELKFVEHSGKAISAGFEDLKETEKYMIAPLNSYLERRVFETATEASINDRNSRLLVHHLAQVLEKIIQSCLFDISKYQGVSVNEDALAVSFSKEFDPKDFQIKVKTLLDTRKTGDISGKTFLEELKNLGCISENIDIEDEQKRILEEEAANTFDNFRTDGSEDAENDEETEDNPDSDNEA